MREPDKYEDFVLLAASILKIIGIIIGLLTNPIACLLYIFGLGFSVYIKIRKWERS